jgi:hypothetical protein
MQKLETESKLVISEYYEYALNDLKNGITIDEMNYFAGLFLLEENYLACAGIKSAIENYTETIKQKQ